MTRPAWEVTQGDQGMGLQHTLDVHHDKFGGVLNGVDYLNIYEHIRHK